MPVLGAEHKIDNYSITIRVFKNKIDFDGSTLINYLRETTKTHTDIKNIQTLAESICLEIGMLMVHDPTVTWYDVTVKDGEGTFYRVGNDFINEE